MNCYSIQKPTAGQKCTDDVYGNMVFNASTWELAENNPSNLFNEAGDWIGTRLNKFTQPDTTGKTFLEKNWILFMVAGIALLILWLFMKKK